MPRHINLEATLGKRLLRASAKQDVIDTLAASAFTPELRRRIYRLWCGQTMTIVRPQDLHDVAPPRRRHAQRALDF